MIFGFPRDGDDVDPSIVLAYRAVDLPADPPEAVDATLIVIRAAALRWSGRDGALDARRTWISLAS